MTIQRIERHSTSRQVQLVILTGASRSGNTLANRIALRSAPDIEVYSFDSAGLP